MPKPYYQDEWVTLYHGEALAILSELPAASFGGLITDPPYSSGGKFRGDRCLVESKAKYLKKQSAAKFQPFSGDARDQRGWTFWSTLWLSEGCRLLSTGGYAEVFTDWRQLPCLTDVFQAAGLTWRGICPWDKGPGARAPHKGYHRHQCEYMVWGTKGPCLKRTDAGPAAGCFRYPTLSKEKKHPTAKPIHLLADLVKFLPAAGTILDPFAGSGTTLAAARWLNRKAVGIEIDEHSAEIAAQWLEEVEPIQAAA